MVLRISENLGEGRAIRRHSFRGRRSSSSGINAIAVAHFENPFGELVERMSTLATSHTGWKNQRCRQEEEKSRRARSGDPHIWDDFRLGLRGT